MGNPFSSVYHKRKKKVLNLKSHCKEWLATGVIGCIFFSKITIIIISALVVYKKPCPHGTKRRSKSTKCKPSCQNSGADWLQKWRHGTYAGAVPAHWQSRWVPVRWHASSTQAAAISAGGLQQRSLHSTATRRLRWSSLPMRCLSSSRYHGIFFWRHVNSSQQINVPIKGKKDAEFSFVHILGRARAVAMNAESSQRRKLEIYLGQATMSRRVCTQEQNTLAGWLDTAQENAGGVGRESLRPRRAGPPKQRACFPPRGGK